MTRGASPAVVQALWSDGPVHRETVAPCAQCGHPLDFTELDPTLLGRTMQRCTNRYCPDRVLRPVVRRLLS